MYYGSDEERVAWNEFRRFLVDTFGIRTDCSAADLADAMDIRHREGWRSPHVTFLEDVLEVDDVAHVIMPASWEGWVAYRPGRSRKDSIISILPPCKPEFVLGFLPETGRRVRRLNRFEALSPPAWNRAETPNIVGSRKRFFRSIEARRRPLILPLDAHMNRNFAAR